jgi:vitamin B12 transporter
MRRLLVCAGILGGAIPVFAQSPPQVSFSESVVVTASLGEATPAELSAAVSVVDAAELAARQTSGLFSLLGTLPGLATTQLGSPGKAATLFARGANSNHTLVLWNGIPLNDPYFGGFDWSNLPAEGVERVEVVRGPFSALWGSDAMGGVVNVITRRAAGSAVSVEGGGRRYRRAALSAGLSRGPFTMAGAGHLRRGEGEVDNDFFDSDDGTLRGNWSFAPGGELGWLARADRSRIGIPFDYSGTPTPRRRQDSRDREAALPAELTWAGLRLESLLSWGRTDLEFRDLDDPYLKSDTEAERRRARAVLTYRPPGDFWVAGGGDWQRQEATAVDAFGEQLDARHQRTRAGFVQAGWKRGPLRLDAGVRQDRNDAYGAATTTKLGAVWQARQALRLRASYGEGFHAPTLADLYYPGFSNPDLDPERSRSLELGAHGRRGAWSWALAGFSTDFEDLIQFDFVTLRPFNTGRARSRGLEAESGWSRGAWSLRWNATRLSTEDGDTGKDLLRRPRTASNLLATWRPGAWTLHAEARYVGSRFDVGDARLPSYTTAAIAAAYRLPRLRALEPYARIENLFDRDYQEAAGFPAPRRRFVAGLAWRP